MALSLTTNIMPMGSSAKTSHEAWSILSRLFANRSCSSVMQIKEGLSQATLGSQSVSAFLQSIKEPILLANANANAASFHKQQRVNHQTSITTMCIPANLILTIMERVSDKSNYSGQYINPLSSKFVQM